MKYPLGGGLIQGGITSDARKLYPAIAHEPAARPGSSMSPARSRWPMAAPAPPSPISSSSPPTAPSFDDSFAAFGRVVEGMEVVKAILAAPIRATKGEGVMKGQMLEPVDQDPEGRAPEIVPAKGKRPGG